jgi:hypothetical protein
LRRLFVSALAAVAAWFGVALVASLVLLWLAQREKLDH